MALVFRTTTTEWTGKGSNLTPEEVDGNFFELHSRVSELEDNPATPVSIADVTVTGQTFTVTLTDSTVLGPFPLPVTSFRWRPEGWVSGTVYSAADLFAYTNEETFNLDIYLVLQEYEAPTEFDSAESNSDGPYLQLIFSVPDSRRIPIVETDTDLQLTQDHFGSYVRVTESATIYVPEESETENAGIPLGGVVTVRAVTADPVLIAGTTEHTINVPAGFTPVLYGAGSTATLVRVGVNEYDLSGDLFESP